MNKSTPTTIGIRWRSFFQQGQLGEGRDAGRIPVTTHEEIECIARSLVEDGRAKLVNNILNYKTDYNYSLTAYHGFGPSRYRARNTLGGPELTGRNETNVTAVISKAYEELVLGSLIRLDDDYH